MPAKGEGGRFREGIARLFAKECGHNLQYSACYLSRNFNYAILDDNGGLGTTPTTMCYASTPHSHSHNSKIFPARVAATHQAPPPPEIMREAPAQGSFPAPKGHSQRGELPPRK